MSRQTAESRDEDESDLVAVSYDGLLNIKQRIARISDFTVPKRGGATVSEIGFYILTLILTFIVYAGIILRILDLLHIHFPWWITLGILVSFPALCTQKLTQPMPHHKTIRETIHSKLRRLFDEPDHRRCKPIPRKRKAADVDALHYAREWERADDAPGADLPRYASIGSRHVEDLRDPPARDKDGLIVLTDLQEWRETRLRLNVLHEREQRERDVTTRRTELAIAPRHFGEVVDTDDDTGITPHTASKPSQPSKELVS